ncbi:Rab-like protein 6 [Homalodisca vitripennis]|nr:Rab-like protein 6 [Homalodisca vitripennis]
MLSALKRLTSKPETSVSSGPPGHHAMSQNLQRKFAKGIQYNMKIIVKGDRNVGKTCLFHRLQGKKFVEEYVPTDEIQVASIQWNYKATDDVVKVEVWDVVDKGKKRVHLEGLKLGENDVNPPALDAEFLDVYKGTNGVILVMDITKNNKSCSVLLAPPVQELLDCVCGSAKECHVNAVFKFFLDVLGSHSLFIDRAPDFTLVTSATCFLPLRSFDYVERELIKIPIHIPVLVLGNHCDMSHHRTVTADIVMSYIDSVQRPKGSAQVRYAEASMYNGFGLKLLHKFFCLPFLQLQRETLLGQLERNETETQATLEELDAFQNSEHADYDK